MLTPKELEALGWDTSTRMSAAEWRMLLAISDSIRQALESGSMTDAARLSGVVYERAREIARETSENIATAASDEASEAIQASLSHDIERIKRQHISDEIDAVMASQSRARMLAESGASTWARHAALDMAQDAAKAYLGIASRHVLMVAAGGESTDVAVARAVEQLSDRGIKAVDYSSGVSEQADAAVRTSIRTIVNQTGNAQTLSVCKAAGVHLIEVTSHVGARPSHAEWQGRVYADPGPVTIDGTTYPDFGQGTGYYGEGPYGALGDRLCGVNCRHSFAPYLHGEPRMWEHDPDGGKGWKNSEVYQDRQTQRAYEREIRKHKNRADLLDEAGGKEAAKEAAAERAKVRSMQKELRDFVDSKDWLQRDYRLERSTKQNAYIAEHHEGA